jgi:hypothetical protein
MLPHRQNQLIHEIFPWILLPPINSPNPVEAGGRSGHARFHSIVLCGFWISLAHAMDYHEIYIPKTDSVSPNCQMCLTIPPGIQADRQL